MLDLRTKILGFIKVRGPSLPVHIAKSLERDIFFAGAVLSELVGKKEVKITTAKIGGSPLYYVTGQEEKLNMLYDHLPMREKEAYKLLEEKKFVLDSGAAPAIRVAFRILKDFAMPHEIKTAQGTTLLWRWHLADINEFKQEQQIKKPQVQEQQVKLVAKPKTTAKKTGTDDFAQLVESYFTKNNIGVREKQIIRKNNESNHTILLKTQLGTLEMFVCAKNKKRITESDLMVANQKGHAKKMVTLFLTTGELTKKAKEYLAKNLKGYLIVRGIS